MDSDDDAPPIESSFPLQHHSDAQCHIDAGGGDPPPAPLLAGELADADSVVREEETAVCEVTTTDMVVDAADAVEETEAVPAEGGETQVMDIAGDETVEDGAGMDDAENGEGNEETDVDGDKVEEEANFPIGDDVNEVEAEIGDEKTNEAPLMEEEPEEGKEHEEEGKEQEEEGKEQREQQQEEDEQEEEQQQEEEDEEEQQPEEEEEQDQQQEEEEEEGDADVGIAEDVEAAEEIEMAEEQSASVSGGKRKRGTGKNSKSTGRAPSRKKLEEDVCFICFDGGDLVLCDRRGCPKAYHPSCVNRDDAFFRAKGKWNCGWHLCSNCERNAHYMCYTCTFSLCKGCIKDTVIYCVRGNRGFCETCMRTVRLIEQNAQGNYMLAEISLRGT